MHDKIYCSAPWKGITIREDGRVRTCCNGREILGDVRQDHIDEILRSPKLEEIKSALRNGNIHSNCHSCTVAERDFNYSTLRHHYQKHYPLHDDDDFSLNFLDVRWNNKCNLACVYCSEQFSSVWEERRGLVRSLAKKDSDQELLDWILEKCRDIKELMLVGGEPMLMKQNHALFKRLPADAKISIITNLCYDFEKLPCLNDLLDRPSENIIWNVSLENTGQKFEYVRHGGSWQQLQKNIKFLVQHWPTTVSLNMVYSLLCAFDLDQTMEFFDSQGVSKFNLLPIHANDEMSMSFMPSAIKQQASDVFERISQWHTKRFGIDQDLYPIDGFADIRQSLTSPSNKQLTKLQVLEKIKRFDHWHQELRFRDLWQQEYQMLMDNLE